MLAHEHINRGVFPFFMIWSLYPAFPGQATPSAFGLFGLAKTLEEAALLIQIMREKAKELNSVNNTSFWTPRKIDMVLLWVDR